MTAINPFRPGFSQIFQGRFDRTAGLGTPEAAPEQLHPAGLGNGAGSQLFRDCFEDIRLPFGGRFPRLEGHGPAGGLPRPPVQVPQPEGCPPDWVGHIRGGSRPPGGLGGE